VENWEFFGLKNDIIDIINTQFARFQLDFVDKSLKFWVQFIRLDVYMFFVLCVYTFILYVCWFICLNVWLATYRVISDISWKISGEFNKFLNGAIYKPLSNDRKKIRMSFCASSQKSELKTFPYHTDHLCFLFPCLSVQYVFMFFVSMFICLYVFCFHVYMFICLYVFMFICLSVYMFICLYVYLFICLSVYMFICLNVNMFLCLYDVLCLYV